MPQVSLNGHDWKVKPYYGEDWRWRDAHMSINRDPRAWTPASVPGSIHHDLWKAGDIPSPYFERNSLLIEWIPARTWVYRKSFRVDAAYRGRRAQLRFEGVDYEAQFFLNGHDMGRHVGMYTPAAFEVGELLDFENENVLAVIVEAAPHEQPQVSRTDRVRTHKSRMTYWWDFCPRMIHIGIWDDVHLKFSGDVRIGDVFVRPVLNGRMDSADVSIQIELNALTTGSVALETILRCDGEIVGRKRVEYSVQSGQTTVEQAISVEQPRLWYPNGYGNQPLYEAEVRVLTADLTVSDGCITRFGIRKIEFVPNDTDDPTARPYTLVVNGRRMYIKGWNWVPMDVMYGVPRPEKLERLLKLATRAHVNMLRVWGGGLIEKESFYNRCDELGILVWQEFIQSSSGIDNNPAIEPAFIDMMVSEAEQIIPRKRNHPSLAIWCGGNELSDGPEQPLDDEHPLLAALKDTVNRLDPDRYWLPTSPTGRVFSNSLDNIQRDASALHDVHGPWEYQGVTGQYTLYNRGVSLLHSEFGVEGITNMKTLNATIAPDHQLPAPLDNPIWHHLGAWWVKTPMWRKTFGEIDEMKTLARATQLMQAEGLRYAVEADRRRKYQNSGTLPWQFNEPYPMAACTSAVDYYGQPKPSYYAVARAYEPTHVSAKFAMAAWDGESPFAAEIWVNRSGGQLIPDGGVHVRVLDFDGQVCGEAWVSETNIMADSAVRVGNINVPLEEIVTDVFFLDLLLTDVDGEALSHNRYSFSRMADLSPFLNVSETTIAVEIHEQVDKNRSVLKITNTGNHTALYLWLEDNRAVNAAGFVYFSDNYFCLMPGEMRSIMCGWSGVPAEERRMRVRAWNTAEWAGCI